MTTEANRSNVKNAMPPLRRFGAHADSPEPFPAGSGGLCVLVELIKFAIGIMIADLERLLRQLLSRARWPTADSGEATVTLIVQTV